MQYRKYAHTMLDIIIMLVYYTLLSGINTAMLFVMKFRHFTFNQHFIIYNINSDLALSALLASLPPLLDA